MTLPFDPDQVTFRRVSEATTNEGKRFEVWDGATSELGVVLRAEVFPGSEQWGVRLQDKVPTVADADLLRAVARLLVWEAGCTAETVDVVLGRTHAHHALVRVGGDYV